MRGRTRYDPGSVRQEARSTLDRVIMALALAVMVADLVSSGMVLTRTCTALIGVFVWVPAVLLWLVGVVLPAGWAAVFGKLARGARRSLACATVLTALPPLLATIFENPHMGRCIA